MWPLIAAMAGAGLVKGLTLDKMRADKERTRDAEYIRNSPWSPIRPLGIHEPNPIGQAMAFGTTGAAIGQNHAMANVNPGGDTSGWTGLSQPTPAGGPQFMDAQNYDPNDIWQAPSADSFSQPRFISTPYSSNGRGGFNFGAGLGN